MRVFSLKTCDTCRKALKALREAGHDPEVIDIRADGMSDRDLNGILAAFGDEAINIRSTTWRGLTDQEQLNHPKELLRDHPTLLKRPVIEHQGTLYQGWTDQVRSALL